jgi:hypothetical protein
MLVVKGRLDQLTKRKDQLTKREGRTKRVLEKCLKELSAALEQAMQESRRMEGTTTPTKLEYAEMLLTTAKCYPEFEFREIPGPFLDWRQKGEDLITLTFGSKSGPFSMDLPVSEVINPNGIVPFFFDADGGYEKYDRKGSRVSVVGKAPRTGA